MTKTESRIWQVIRRRSVDGWRFRRQFPVGTYVLDFYCPALRLAVEVDGTHHRKRVHRDRARDRDLARYEIRVIRFRTVDVIENLDGVYVRLQLTCRERAKELGLLEWEE